MSIFAPNTVAYSWELLQQLTEQLSSFHQKPWRTQACLSIYKAYQSARALGFSYQHPEIKAAAPEQHPQTIEATNNRAPKHKSDKLCAAFMHFGEALHRRDFNEAIARIFYLQNAHSRQQAWLMVGWCWLEQQNLIGAQQMLEKLTLPQLQEEKLLLQAELFYQQEKYGRAARYLACLEPNIRRYSFVRRAFPLDFIARCLSLQTRLWSQHNGSLRVTPQQAKLLCTHRLLLQSVYQNLAPRSIEELLEAQPGPVAKRLREAFRFAKLDQQCEQITRCFEQAQPVPEQATTPEEAYWLGALCQNQSAPQGELRAYFDAGKATHPEHKATEVLSRASKRELEDAVKQNHASNAVMARLQCLASLPRVSIVDWLRTLFVQHPSDLDPALFGVILQRSPKQARGLFLEEFLRITANGENTAHWLERLQHAKVFGAHFSQRLLTLQREIQIALSERHGGRWVGCLLRAWWRRFGQAPSPEALRSISEGFLELTEAQRQAMLSLEPEQAAQQLLQEGEAATRRLLSLAPGELIVQLNSQRKHLHLLQCFAPEPLPNPWDDGRWATALAQLRGQTSRVDLAMVETFAKKLSFHQSQPLNERLLLGQCPVEEFASPIPIEAPYSLRYLDKRKDLLAFLRLADAVTCCFSSVSHKGAYYNQRWIFDLWKDPLSFCFWVEEHSEESGTLPFGFVFGSFAVQSQQPAVMLNGLYLKRQKPMLREKLLACLEESFCRPLRIKRVSISNCHAGYGALPSSYQATPTKVTRLRALQDASGMRLKSVYDDISYRLNEEFTTHSSTYWKQLA